jgi:hypothetical protein
MFPAISVTPWPKFLLRLGRSSGPLGDRAGRRRRDPPAICSTAGRSCWPVGRFAVVAGLAALG